MDPKIQAMLELEKRGKLPPNYAPLLAEARNRGLIPGGEAPAAPTAPGKSFGQTVRENLFGDNDPNTQNFGERIGTALNKAGESMTMGLIGDEASAAVESLVPGLNYQDRRDHYRQQEQVLERDNPALALGADIGGALAAPLGALGALGKGAGLAKRALTSAGVSGAMSGVYGGMEGEGGADNRLDEALNAGKWGAAIGAAIPGVGAAYQAAAKSRTGKKLVDAAVKAAPSTDELRRAGRAAYRAVEDAGVQIKPQAFSRVRQEIVDALRQNGLDELPGPGSLTPKAARVNQIAGEMETAMGSDPTAALPFRSLDQLRRHAGTAAADLNKTDSALGSKTIEMLDDFVDGLGPDDVTAGDVEALPGLIAKARDTWQRMSKSQLIDDAIEAGEQQYLSGSGTGLKYQFKRILRNPKLSRGFTDAEKKMMGRVVNGTIPEQILRLAGSGITHIAAPLAGFGMAGGGVPGAAASLGALGLSRAARMGSDRIIGKNAEIARALVASGGVPNVPAITGQKNRAIIEQLMRQGTAASVQ